MLTSFVDGGHASVEWRKCLTNFKPRSGLEEGRDKGLAQDLEAYWTRYSVLLVLGPCLLN
jgi:hypothetical protein